MRLPEGARIAVIGAGPSGLATAKHALEAGFDTTVFEASDDLGGQWQTGAAHSGVWPGMHTNTSRAMTAFSDFPAPDAHPLHPAAEQIHAYLRAYADAFGVTPRIRFGTPRRARGARAGRSTASASTPSPSPPAASAARACRRGSTRFGGELLHAFDYPGAEPFRGRRVLVYGNGISGLEIASDLAGTADVISAFRKPRYVIQQGRRRRLVGLAVVHGVRRARARGSSRPPSSAAGCASGSCGSPATPRRSARRSPTPTSSSPGVSLCQDYLAQVADGSIVCRPAIAAVERDAVRFADGTRAPVDAIVCATGYELDLPFLDPAVWAVTGPDLRLYRRTLHPDLPGFGAVGHVPGAGPVLPAARAAGALARRALGRRRRSRRTARRCAARSRPRRRRSRSHNVFATAVAARARRRAGPARAARADRAAAVRPDAAAALPARRAGRAAPGRPARSEAQLAASPRAPVDPADVEALRGFGLGAAADLV